MRVDGHEVEATGTVLDACQRAGVHVDTFCHGGPVSTHGHCRSCLVEADGRLVAACTTPAAPGMEVRTDTPALLAYRRDLGELMRSESTPAGPVGRALERWGVDGTRYPALAEDAEADRSHPYLRWDLGACVRCQRCVDACAEVQGQFVLSMLGRGAEARPGWKEGPFVDSGCVGCGACVAVCPSGALSDRDRERGLDPDRVVRTTCAYCGVGCQLDVAVAQDRVAWVDAAPVDPNRGHLCVKGRYAHAFVDHPDRLRTPLIRRDGALVEASWDEALAAVVEGFRAAKGAVAGLSSARCTNEENYLLQKWMRVVWGSNSVDCCARVCHAPSAAGMRSSLGTGAATNALADIERADLLMVVGANPTEAHPVTGARIRQAVLAGAGLVVIDPRRTELAALADVHLQNRPGSNVPLFNSLACVLVEEGLLDEAFLEARAEDWRAWRGWVLGHPPERWEAVTGVPAAKVRDAARRYGRALRPMMVHGLGVTEHHQGSEAVRLLCNLALARGAIGREGVGVNPLRGQNNVQGAADMGCQPDFTTGYQAVDDPAARARVGAVWGVPVPEGPGLRLPDMLEAAREGRLRALFVLGEDLVATEPDTEGTRRALQAVDFLVVQELFLSETAKLAHVVLPGASFLEKEGTFTNGERRVQRVRAALSPRARPDWETLLALFAAAGHPQPLANPAEVFDEIRAVWPAVAGMDHDRLDEGGVQWPAPAADQPGTPILHREAFPIGRARMARVEYVASPGVGAPLLLTTGRRLEHYNSGSMTRRTPNLALHDADRLEIHPDDARHRGVEPGDRVRVRSARATIEVEAEVTDRVRPGTVFLSFHHPEAATNRLLGHVRDRVTGCPEFKVEAVEVERAEGDPTR